MAQFGVSRPTPREAFRILEAENLISAGGNETLDDFRRSLRSYEKLVKLLEARDGAGAERHWRAHMETAGQRLLGEDLQHRPVVDLFA